MSKPRIKINLNTNKYVETKQGDLNNLLNIKRMEIESQFFIAPF